MAFEKLKNINLKEEFENLKGIIDTFLSNYKEANPAKLRLIDSFIVFNAILVVLQIIYLVTNGFDPVNSFLSGVFSCLGFLTLLICLRLHVNPKTKLKDTSVEQVYAEFFVACVLLFFVAVNYVG